jgi:hypothetical protein
MHHAEQSVSTKKMWHKPQLMELRFKETKASLSDLLGKGESNNENVVHYAASSYSGQAS